MDLYFCLVLADISHLRNRKICSTPYRRVGNEIYVQPGDSFFVPKFL